MARIKQQSSVTVGQRTANSDRNSRRLLEEGLAGRDVLTLTLAPRVYSPEANRLLPGNSHKFRFGTKREAVEFLGRLRKFAEDEAERLAAARLAE